MLESLFGAIALVVCILGIWNRSLKTFMVGGALCGVSLMFGGF